MRMAVFVTIVLLFWTALNAYVVWRLTTIPLLAPARTARLVWIAGALLWASFPLARILGRRLPDAVAAPLDHVGSNWVGVLFFLFVLLLAADLATGFGRLLPAAAPKVRAAAAVAALVLSAIALFLGTRDPVLRDYEVRLADLPADRDGTTIVLLTDLHLGTMLGERWLAPLVDRVRATSPDLIVVGGDLLDGDTARVEPMVPLLRRLRAPLGAFAVTGNHEIYAGLDRSTRLLADCGFTVLRDEAREAAPGLVLAGVDDLTARGRIGMTGDPVAAALDGRPPGATIFLSHSPLRAEEAAARGADLMLSGHTHEGQLWPFGYLVALRYPLLAGRYEVDGMPVIVSRGAGTWGPRMRLWRRSEIVRITLRSAGRGN